MNVEKSAGSYLYSTASFFYLPAELWLTSPVTCYILDGFLIIYCLITTALFFREKVRCAWQTSREELREYTPTTFIYL